MISTYHLIITYEPKHKRYYAGAAEYNGLGMYSSTVEGAIRNLLATIRDVPDPDAHRCPNIDSVNEWSATGRSIARKPPRRRVYIAHLGTMAAANRSAL